MLPSVFSDGQRAQHHCWPTLRRHVLDKIIGNLGGNRSCEFENRLSNIGWLFGGGVGLIACKGGAVGSDLNGAGWQLAMRKKEAEKNSNFLDDFHSFAIIHFESCEEMRR